MVSIAAIVILLIGIFLAGTGTFLGFYLFPKLVGNQVEESVKLIEGTEAYERWQELPIPVVFKLYFFNVSNPDEVQNGGKPVLTEIGPYVYNQYREKMNITEDGPDILSYNEHTIFEFDADASYPLTDTDDITIGHLPMMSVFTAAEYIAGSSTAQMTALNGQVNRIFNNPTDVFLQTTPKDFLFDGVYLMCNTTGLIASVVCNRIEANAPVLMPRLPDGRFKFSLLSHKNNTNEGRYSVNNGVVDVSQLGEISSWENSSTLSFWENGSTCNELFGCDATIFPPFRTPESEVVAFILDVCRTVELHYSEDITYSGIKGHRYITEEELLASPSKRPENECYCLNRTQGIRGEDGCLLDGAMELWDCQGAPVVLTLPHFYLADEQYQNGVEGLTPNKTLHQIFVDLEPYTGTPLRGSKRAQFNIFYRPINRISLTTDLDTFLMPIVWIDEGVELNDELIEQLNTTLFDILKILSGVVWGLTIVGLVFCVVGLFWLILSCCGSKKVK